MNDSWTDRWNERYSNPAFAYGEAPNNYLKEQLEKLSPGKILLPAEGEGRNAVYAATLGWTAFAFDISNEGKNKALQLAKRHNVSINYEVYDLEALPYSPGQFDAIGLIYAHFPANVKSAYHKALDKYLRKGGIIVFEAFSKQHITYMERDKNMGGPKDIDALFSIDEVKADFENYDFRELTETAINLAEGQYLNGEGCVIRFVAEKK